MKRKYWLLLTIIFLAAVALRAYQNFGSYLVPGLNGGYYPVQVRAIIETWRLAYPDSPLAFYFEAGIALVVRLISQSSLHDAVLFTVKFVDSFFPPLVIFPLFIFGQKFLKEKYDWILLMLLAALSSLSIFSLLGLSAEFTKNALAMLFVGLTFIKLKDKRSTLLWQIGFTILAALTHKTGLVLASYFLLLRYLPLIPEIQKFTHKQMVLSATSIIILAWAYLFFAGDSVVSYILARTPIISNENMIGIWSTSIILALLIVDLRKIHSSIPKQIFIPLLGTLTLTTLLITPFLGKSYAERLWFISVIPLIITVICALPYLSKFGKILIGTTAAICIYLSIEAFLNFSKLPIVKQQAYNEIVSQTAALSTPNSIIIADHGIDWWTAWGTHLPAAQDHVLTKQQLKEFSHVYFINYFPQKDVYYWFGTVTIPDKAKKMFEGTYITVYQCQQDCF